MQALSLSKRNIGFILGAALALAVLLPAMLFAAPVHAQDNVDQFFGGAEGTLTGEDFATQAGLGSGHLPATIAQIIRVALGFLGIVAVVIILFGGFKWMTAGGNDDKVKEAKKLIISGIIGLVIILSAFAIATFVLSQVQSAVTAG
jgi:hypothetical protein